MNLKLMVTKTYSLIFLKFKIKFNLNHFCISFLVNLSSKPPKENLQKTVKNVLMESVKELQQTIIAVCIRNFVKEDNLMTVKNIFVIADPSNVTKYK